MGIRHVYGKEIGVQNFLAKIEQSCDFGFVRLSSASSGIFELLKQNAIGPFMPSMTCFQFSFFKDFGLIFYLIKKNHIIIYHYFFDLVSTQLIKREKKTLII